MATERSERELNLDINAAIAGTEDEIFREALDGDLDDNDGDNSLEEMGEGLEGDDLEDEEESEEVEAAAESEEEEGDEEQDEEDAEEEDEQPRDQRGRFDTQEQRIPPARLREEAEARRQAQQRAEEADRRYAILEARFNDMQTRLNAQPAPKKEADQPAPKPDMFAEPEKYEAWVLDQAERRAQERLDARLAERDRQQQEARNRAVDENLSLAARGERSFEFQAAYNKLTSLDSRDPQSRATVQRIYNSQDPAQALFDWWDNNGGPEYREQILNQLSPRQQPRERRQVQQQPVRQVYRPAQRMPSLNSASGSNSNRTPDPDMYDGSDGSVFEYATRR